MIKKNFIALFGILASIALFPQEEEISPSYSRRINAENFKLSQVEINRLGKEKFIISKQSFKQIFIPYTEPNTTFFITTDSILNGFHVLFEETVMQMESAQIHRLTSFLRYVWMQLPKKSRELKFQADLVKKARIQAQIVVGTTMKLLGINNFGIDSSLIKIIDREVGKVIQAEAIELPTWLAPQDQELDAIDYSVFKPRGFYTKTAELQKYFRALKWLQTIPFRISRDYEFLAAALIAYSLQEEYYKDSQYSLLAYLEDLHQFLGSIDDLDVRRIVEDCQSLYGIKDLNKLKKEIFQFKKFNNETPMINDQISLLQENPQKVYPVSNIRIISAFQLPDAVLFQTTTDIRNFQRPFPTGLEISSVLGSSLAKNLLIQKENNPLLMKTLAKYQAIFHGNSLYQQYLYCLAALLEPAGPDFPEFMKSVSWETKNIQTTLSGWALMRHTWQLQAKENVTYAGLNEIPPGFVEPVPEFYNRLAELVKQAIELFQKVKTFEPDLSEMKSEIGQIMQIHAQLILHNDFSKKGLKIFTRKFSKYDWGRYIQNSKKWINPPFIDWDTYEKDEDIPEESFRQILINLQENFKKIIKQGSLVEGDPLYESFFGELKYIESLWKDLEYVCRKLESLAHKQLRRIPFSEEDNKFVLSYGERLGHIMLYGGNSYLEPKDDAPRIADVLWNSQIHKAFEVGIGRPRAIYVLYPTAKGEVLCIGSVMSYYEFPWSSRLNDEDWRKLLDSPEFPEQPEWLESILYNKEN